MAKLQTFQENWVSNSNVIGGLYSGFFGTTTISGNQCRYTIASGATNYQGFNTTNTFTLIDSYVFMQLVNAGNQALVSLEVFLAQVAPDGNNNLSWRLNQNTLSTRKKVATIITDVTTLAYTAGTHNYFRIRELNGVVYWDWSTDGIEWTNQYSEPTPITITAVQLFLSAGIFGTEASGTTVITGNINIVDTNKPGNMFRSVKVGGGMSRSEGAT